MGASVRFPLRRLSGLALARPVSNDIAGELLAGEIVTGIQRHASTRGLDSRRVMLDVLLGLVTELAGNQTNQCRPADLADMVRVAAEESTPS